MDSDASIPNREVSGQEILLYDGKRRPHDWSEVLLERQCAVFLRNARLGVPVGADLKPRRASAATCIVFDFIADAESLCRGVVAERPDIECEILDCEGRANPPLTIIGINLIVAALRLFFWDSGEKQGERGRIARLDAHRRRERDAAGNTPPEQRGSAA